MDASTLAAMAQAGGLMAFAAAVWHELRTQRAERRTEAALVAGILSEIRGALSALLERDRMRAETPARGVSIPVHRAASRPEDR